MKTAVEFYREELNALVSFKESKFKTEQEIFEQAKEMEKEQREEDLESGFDTGRLYQGREGDTTLGQLKSQTFKSE